MFEGVHEAIGAMASFDIYHNYIQLPEFVWVGAGGYFLIG